MLAALSGCPQGAPSPSPAPAATSEVTKAGTPVAPPSGSPVAQASDDFLIVPNQRFGPITADSTEASLRKQFGDDQVKRGKMYVGDGMEWDGVAVFPDQPDKRVEVFWPEGDPKHVQLIQIQGDSSQWKTAQGVSLGTTLIELEKANGRPFELLGLGWDFGGGVTDWKGGVLEGLTLRCDSAFEELSETESAAISGDQTVKSDNPTMQKVNPKVSKITLNFVLPDASPSP